MTFNLDFILFPPFSFNFKSQNIIFPSPSLICHLILFCDFVIFFPFEASNLGRLAIHSDFCNNSPASAIIVLPLYQSTLLRISASSSTVSSSPSTAFTVPSPTTPFRTPLDQLTVYISLSIYTSITLPARHLIDHLVRCNIMTHASQQARKYTHTNIPPSYAQSIVGLSTPATSVSPSPEPTFVSSPSTMAGRRSNMRRSPQSQPEISLPITYTPTTHRISKAKKGKRVHACEYPGCNKVCAPVRWEEKQFRRSRTALT